MAQMPTLRTTRLILRPFATDDAAPLHENVGKWEVARTIPNMPHPYEDGMAEEWISRRQAVYDSGENVSLAVTLRTDGRLIGGVGLRLNASNRSAELGYWMSPAQWGQGYCTEAAREGVRYAFDDLDLNRVEAHHMTNNPASGRVMQKLGMRYEGTLRQAIYKWDGFVDIALYSILRDEYVVDLASR